MEKTIDVREAQARFADLLSLVAAGTEITLLDGGVPRARIIPIAITPPPRVAGLHAGAISANDDFDDPLPDTFWTGAS